MRIRKQCNSRQNLRSSVCLRSEIGGEREGKKYRQKNLELPARPKQKISYRGPDAGVRSSSTAAGFVLISGSGFSRIHWLRALLRSRTTALRGHRSPAAIRSWFHVAENDSVNRGSHSRQN